MTVPARPPNEPSVATDEAGATLALQTYLHLRQDIVSACFAPGEKLRTRTLCARYDVGFGPVREALTRLSREGLVVQTDRRGFAVPPFGQAHLEELTRTRIWLNGLALRAATGYASPAWEQELILAYHRLSALPRYVLVDGLATFNPQWESAHAHFHLTLVNGCRSTWLVDCCAQMFEAMNYYRYRSRVTQFHRKRREDEHTLLFNAVMARDADKAVELLASHLQRTTDLVLQRMAAEANVARETVPGASARRTASRAKSSAVASR